MFISAVESVASMASSVAKAQKFNRAVTVEINLDLGKTVHLGSGMISGLCESIFRRKTENRGSLLNIGLTLLKDIPPPSL